MLLVLDTENGMPLSRQIYEKIKSLILGGELAEKERLPSSRAFSKELGVARNTVLEAYEQLLAEGYLESRHGSGTIVATGITPMRQKDAPDEKALPAYTRQTDTEGGIINFRSGIPDLEAFPKKEWGKLYHRVCERLPGSALRYSEQGGVWELREAIAAYLFRMRGIRVSLKRIMITSGSTQGLFLVSRLLREKGKSVLVEDPAHAGLVAVVAKAEFALKGIKTDEFGMDTALLQDLTQKEISRVAFAYVTPSHQYPLGGILPIQRRQALVRFAAEAACFIVEDDYDSEFRYEGAPVSSLFELAPDIVIYLGSFSKILAPALRLGFAIIPESMIEAWEHEKLYTDVHTDALSQHVLAEFINNGGLERHIWKMKKLYKRKREYLLRCMSQNFGNQFEVRGQTAGLHLVAGFPGVVFADNLLNGLYERGIKVAPVEAYSLCRDGAHDCEIILGYSHLSEEEMSKGVSILRDGLAAISGR